MHPPLHLFISGAGGTGKSFLISVLRRWVQHTFDNPLAVAVSAPTGIAAFSVRGVTVHRLLQLPIEHGLCAQYYKLGAEALSSIRSKLSG